MSERIFDSAAFLLNVRGETFAELCQSVCERLRAWDARYDWVGIYWVEGDELILKAWSGKQATEHVRISVDRGICGAAVRESRTVIVDDVTADPRYLSCFLDTRSEIVVPIRANGSVVGEIDIDGNQVNAFDERDRVFLELVARFLGDQWQGTW